MIIRRVRFSAFVFQLAFGRLLKTRHNKGADQNPNADETES